MGMVRLICFFMTDFRKASQLHSFHLVTISPWPIYTALSVGCLVLGIAFFFHNYSAFCFSTIYHALELLLLGVALWWRDVIREGSLEGQHTKKVQRGLTLGIVLFIVSEVLFFFAFFWSYFYFSFNPLDELESIWPPLGIDFIKPFELPLFNTIILLCSGATVTWTHHAILAGKRYEAVISLLTTVVLGYFFLEMQLLEYTSASFSISDSVYGSIFYLMTGFHGAHVFIGACFLTVCLFRLVFNHFSLNQHIGFEAAAWYWHFVDIVWILLFFIVYIWGIL